MPTARSIGGRRWPEAETWGISALKLFALWCLAFLPGWLYVRFLRYEARLIEEGVEDRQNLTTMNLIDVILHTQVPPGRLVDWIDQAFPRTHLESADRDELTRLRRANQPAAVDRAPLSWAQARVNLRRTGIRTATDLLKAFSEEQDGQHTFRLLNGLKPPVDQLRLLAAGPGLAPVWTWQWTGVRER